MILKPKELVDRMRWRDPLKDTLNKTRRDNGAAEGARARIAGTRSE